VARGDAVCGPVLQGAATLFRRFIQVERIVADFCRDGDRRGVARGRQHSSDLETPTVSQTVAMPHMKWQSREEKCVLQCSAAE
jgi:hypothetical protein